MNQDIYSPAEILEGTSSAIDFVKSIPEKKWVKGSLHKHGSSCALGHVQERMKEMFSTNSLAQEIFAKYGNAGLRAAGLELENNDSLDSYDEAAIVNQTDAGKELCLLFAIHNIEAGVNRYGQPDEEGYERDGYIEMLTGERDIEPWLVPVVNDSRSYFDENGKELSARGNVLFKLYDLERIALNEQRKGWKPFSPFKYVKATEAFGARQQLASSRCIKVVRVQEVELEYVPLDMEATVEVSLHAHKIEDDGFLAAMLASAEQAEYAQTLAQFSR
jgi:hypothetical protein